MSKARGLADLGNAYSDGALSNRNMVINGDFSVSQRGDFATATSISNLAYSVDRFKTVVAGSATVTRKTNQVLPSGDYANTLLIALTGNGYTGGQQYVEDFNRLKGKTITLSAWVKSNVTASLSIYDGFSQPAKNHTGSGQWEKLTLTHTCSTNTNQMRIEAWTNSGRVSGNYVEMTQVQLEVGDTATPFEHRSFGQELALCQRYFQLISADTGTGTGTGICNGLAESATQIRGVLPLAASMRSVPTIGVSDPTHFTLYTTASHLFGAGSYFSGTSRDAVYTYGVSTGMTAGHAGQILFNNPAGKIYVDAEL